MRPLPLALLCCAASLAGQQFTMTAHPQETLQSTNGNFSPLGCYSNGSGAEARSQILLRGFELPGPGSALLGLEVRSWQSQALTYSSLQIDVQPTAATSLSTTFAANVPAPHTVLQATALPFAYATGRWTPIPFPTPYVHDGSSSLVIDIRKVVDPTTIAFVTMDNCQSPPRTDRPQMVYSFGMPGSGAANSLNAFGRTEPIALRLRWVGPPTVRNSGSTWGAWRSSPSASPSTARWSACTWSTSRRRWRRPGCRCSPTGWTTS
jgi:hypothetical protein